MPDSPLDSIVMAQNKCTRCFSCFVVVKHRLKWEQGLTLGEIIARLPEHQGHGRQTGDGRLLWQYQNRWYRLLDWRTHRWGGSTKPIEFYGIQSGRCSGNDGIELIQYKKFHIQDKLCSKQTINHITPSYVNLNFLEKSSCGIPCYGIFFYCPTSYSPTQFFREFFLQVLSLRCDFIIYFSLFVKFTCLSIDKIREVCYTMCRKE